VTKISPGNYKCQYCNKSFKRESTLASHTCEPKRRWQQESDRGVQLGFVAYNMFYEYTQHSKKSRTYADFVSSPYYLGFVRYGRYCQELKCINVPKFTEWLLRQNTRLDDWTSDRVYQTWLVQFLQRESAQDALERALLEMQRYADQHPELKNGFRDYFRYVTPGRICHHISSGRISPWVIYHCESGIEFLSGLSEDLSDLIISYIDPGYWGRRFQDRAEDVAWVREILQQAGL
jgi:hypothetical protein